MGNVPKSAVVRLFRAQNGQRVELAPPAEDAHPVDAFLRRLD